MKKKRQARILELIQDYEISTQEELISHLIKDGFDTTQATVSRDMRQLHLVKHTDNNGVVRYAVSSESKAVAIGEKMKKIFRECVTHFENAQNIVVIKTLPGLAMAAAGAMDHLEDHSVIGTIAGDDTVFAVLHDTEAAANFCEQIRNQIQ